MARIHKCPICGEHFECTRSTKDYCSNRCRQRSYRERKAKLFGKQCRMKYPYKRQPTPLIDGVTFTGDRYDGDRGRNGTAVATINRPRRKDVPHD